MLILVAFSFLPCCIWRSVNARDGLVVIVHVESIALGLAARVVTHLETVLEPRRIQWDSAND